MVKLVLFMFISLSRYEAGVDADMLVKEIMVPDVRSCEILGNKATEAAALHEDAVAQNGSEWALHEVTVSYKCIPLPSTWNE